MQLTASGEVKNTLGKLQVVTFSSSLMTITTLKHELNLEVEDKIRIFLKSVALPRPFSQFTRPYLSSIRSCILIFSSDKTDYAMTKLHFQQIKSYRILEIKVLYSARC